MAFGRSQRKRSYQGGKDSDFERILRIDAIVLLSLLRQPLYI
jgi:hypothetical protein